MKKICIVFAFLVVFTPSARAAENEIDTLRAILGLLVEMQAHLEELVETSFISMPTPISESFPSGDGMTAGVLTAVTTPASLTEGGTSDQLLTITIGEEVVNTFFVPTSADALIECEKTAYNTDFMWKQVECVYAGESIYKDIFVAG